MSDAAGEARDAVRTAVAERIRLLAATPETEANAAIYSASERTRISPKGFVRGASLLLAEMLQAQSAQLLLDGLPVVSVLAPRRRRGSRRR